ncbi:MAG: hypothetical protein Q9218_006007 [Villophora microphyllina]
MTAAIGLYQRFEGLPLPWHPTTKKIPMIIYGAASAVGAYAIKLAQLSNIHPLICVAGRGTPFVETLIDKSKGDTILDYRDGNDKLIEGLKSAVDRAGGKVQYAFDAVSEEPSFINICKVLDHETGQMTLVLPYNDYSAVPASVRRSQTMVGAVHASGDEKGFQKDTGSQTGDMDFGFVFFRFFSRGLQEGWFSGHPEEVVPGGLAGVEGALRNLKEGKASAVKYVFRLEDTEDSVVKTITLMEPISAFASVLGIATAAVQVSKALNAMLNGIRDAPYEICRLSEDLQSISAILASLESTLKDNSDRHVLEDNKAIVRSLKDLKSPLRSCTKVIKDIKNKIEPCLGLLDDGKSYRLKTRWWFNKDATKSLIVIFESTKQTLNISMSNVSLVCNFRTLPTKQAVTSTKPKLSRCDSADTDAGFALRRYIAASVTAADEDRVESEGDLEHAVRSNEFTVNRRRVADSITSAEDIGERGHPAKKESLWRAAVNIQKSPSSTDSATSILPMDVLSMNHNNEDHANKKYTKEDYTNRQEALPGWEDSSFAAESRKTNGDWASLDQETNDEVEKKSLVIDPSSSQGSTNTLLQTIRNEEFEHTKRRILQDFAIRELEDGQRDLFLNAVRRGYTPQVQEYLAQGGDPNTSSSDGRTALHCTAVTGFIDAAKMLLNAGAKIDVQTIPGRRTPLLEAVSNGHTQMAQLLIDEGADVTASDWEDWTPLHYAVYHSNVDMTRMLIDRRADIEAVTSMQNSHGLQRKRWLHTTPLFLAAWNGDAAITEMLLAAGADPRAQIIDKATTLHAAVYGGRAVVASMLLDAAEQLDQREENLLDMKRVDGDTALHVAASKARFDFVELLISRGADTSSKNAMGRNPLQCSQQSKHSKDAKRVSKLLRDHTIIRKK